MATAEGRRVSGRRKERQSCRAARNARRTGKLSGREPLTSPHYGALRNKRLHPLRGNCQHPSAQCRFLVLSRQRRCVSRISYRGIGRSGRKRRGCLIYISGAAQAAPSTKEEESKMTGYDFDSNEREIGTAIGGC